MSNSDTSESKSASATNERPTSCPKNEPGRPCEVDLAALLADLLPRHKRVEEWLERVHKLPWRDEDERDVEECILDAFRLGKELNLSAFDPVSLKKGDRLSLRQYVTMLAFKRQDTGRVEIVNCIAEAIEDSGIRIDVGRESLSPTSRAPITTATGIASGSSPPMAIFTPSRRAILSAGYPSWVLQVCQKRTAAHPPPTGGWMSVSICTGLIWHSGYPVTRRE